MTFPTVFRASAFGDPRSFPKADFVHNEHSLHLPFFPIKYLLTFFLVAKIITEIFLSQFLILTINSEIVQDLSEQGQKQQTLLTIVKQFS